MSGLRSWALDLPSTTTIKNFRNFLYRVKGQFLFTCASQNFYMFSARGAAGVWAVTATFYHLPGWPGAGSPGRPGSFPIVDNWFYL